MGLVNHLVAVVGAGPAGLFAAREMALNGVRVVLLNRDIKPGGLAEYGIYPDKHKMKNGLRLQFRQTLALENVTYFGNVLVGDAAGLSLEDLREVGFQAILVAAGAQKTKWLGIPGENLKGVYHAKDLVFNYNKLPPYSQKSFEIGQRVAIVGAGNVMMDVAHYLIEEKKVQEIIGIARRGPGEVKFERKEVETVAAHFDMTALQVELQRVSPVMRALDQDVSAAQVFFESVREKAVSFNSPTRFQLQFLASPVRILNDGNGKVGGLELEENTLECSNGEARAVGLGQFYTIPVDTVIYAIGDSVDPGIGIPLNGSEFCKNPTPRFPVEDLSYEACDPACRKDMKDIFVAGWSRKASTGLVGLARRDGTNAAKAVMQYLETLPPLAELPVERIEALLKNLPQPVAREADIAWLEVVEQDRAHQMNLEEFKFDSNEEMLRVMRDRH
jgi:ferredoxin/flavodoxin---NADP+ reductase